MADVENVHRVGRHRVEYSVAIASDNCRAYVRVFGLLGSVGVLSKQIQRIMDR
jgi:hypothetical protein